MRDSLGQLKSSVLAVAALFLLATAAPAIATPELSVQHGIVSYCSLTACSRYRAIPNPDGTLSFVALAEAPTLHQVPDTVGEIERKLQELLKQLLKLPRTCIWCDLTLKQLWDSAIKKWLEGLGLRNVPDGASLLCPNRDTIKKLLEDLGGKISTGGTLQPFLDLVRGIRNTPGLSQEIQDLLRQLEQLLQQSGDVDSEALQRLIRAIKDLIWKLIFGPNEVFPSQPAPAISQAPADFGSALSGLALPAANCSRRSDVEAGVGGSSDALRPWEQQ